MTRAADETIINEDIIPVNFSLNFTSFSFHPAAKRQLPKISTTIRNEIDKIRKRGLTSKIDDRILPTMLDWTIRNSPWIKAVTPTFRGPCSQYKRFSAVVHGRLTIISTRLPQVALSNPPIVCPTLAATCSVDQDSSSASGKMAKKLRVKRATGFHFRFAATMARGTKGMRRFALEKKSVVFVVR
jgi:hypothetical protein